MPRADATSFYQSQFNSHYVPNNDHHSQQSPVHGNNHQNPPQSPSATQSSSHTASQKKKHICPTCDRAFTTSGHLARHSRVHTGERNHKCPFPGCETRCSRQDNLQQHYRIHLSPGSRRSSTRSAIARAMNSSVHSLPNSTLTRRASTSSSIGSPSIPPPLSSPPALEPARYALSTPPDSPPPLAHATLPATAHPPPGSVSSRSSSSPEISYSPVSPSHHHSQMVPLSSHPMNLSSQNYSHSHYRSGTTTYQEQAQGAGFTYVHTTPITQSSTAPSVHHNSFSYSNGHYDSHHNIPDSNHSSHQNHSPPSPPSNHVSSITSRHSISHISHPQQRYTSHQTSNPPSPASSHSVSSQQGPATPSYTVFHDDTHSYQNGNIIMEQPPDQPNHLGSGHINSQGALVHPSYSPTLPLPSHSHSHPSRFHSPPPTLAPIQSERVVRGDSHGRQSNGSNHVPSHHSNSSYLHHPQPLGNEYHYHQPMGLGQWKADGPLRSKAVGTLVQ